MPNDLALNDSPPSDPALVIPATRAAGLARLAAVTSDLGRRYADGRNTDAGPDRDPTTSALSPYLRRRMVLEREVVVSQPVV